MPFPTSPDSSDAGLRRIPPDCLAIFRRAFAGRDDAWWHVREDGNGRLLTEPAMVDGRPVTLASHHLEEHLAGSLHVAVRPLLSDGTVCFVVIALHSRAARTWKTDTCILAKAARRLGVPLLMELTRSGQGTHAWVFFSEPVPAADARRLGAALLLEAGDGDHLRVRSFDRIHPADPTVSQPAEEDDIVPLPLQGSMRTRDLTVFVQPQRGLPTLPDQWALLALLPRMGPADIQRVLRRTLGQAEPLPVLPPREGSSHATLEATLSASLAVARPLPRQVAAWLREILVIDHPAWERRRQQGLSLKGIPRVHAAFRRCGTGWLLPRTLADSLQRLCASLGMAFEMADARCRLLAEPRPLPTGLEPEGRRTLEQLLASDFCTLEMRQVPERTVVAVSAIASRGIPTLVVTSNPARLEAWREYCILWLGLDRVATLDETEEGAPATLVTLATYTSFTRSRPPAGLENRFGHLVLDDCTHAPIASIRHVAERVPAAYVLGLKDGPRQDGLDRLVNLFVGPTLHRPDRSFTPLLDVVLRITDFTWRPDETAARAQGKSQWNNLLLALSHDSARNALVAGDVLAEARAGESCLVYTARREHALELSEILERRQHSLELSDPLTPRVVIATAIGTIPSTQRRETLRRFRNREVSVLVATEQLIGAGFDCPHLSRAFLAFPVKSEGQLRPYLQSLLRHPQENSLPRVYDYVDERVHLLDSMGRTRRRLYQRENTTLNHDAMQLRLPFPDNEDRPDET